MHNFRQRRLAVLASLFIYLSLVVGLTRTVHAQELLGPTTTEQGIQLYEQGELQRAAKVLEQVVAKRPGDADAWYYLGLARYKQGWIGAALLPFERVVELRPNSADARAKLSYALILGNKPQKAIAMAQSAIDLGDQSAEAHYAIAEASLRSNEGGSQFETAIQHADAALKINPRFSVALITKSFAHYKLEQYSEAAESLERYLALSPNDLDADTWRQHASMLAERARVVEPITGPSIPGTATLKPREVSQKARVFSKPEPSYTEEARRKGVEGTVVLRAVFSSDGEITNLRVTQALPFGLTTASLQAARRIRFTPAMKDGKPVSMYIQLEYNFNLF